MNHDAEQHAEASYTTSRDVTLADDLEAEQVVRALGEGWSWARIAEALDVIRQAVQKKAGHRIRPDTRR